MSLWPRSSISPFVSEPSFTPLFRLLEDFDTYSRGPSGATNSNGTTSLKSFQPKFDVKEVDSAYELHGELPGIDQKDIEVEFADPQTITIRGRTERHYERGSRPAVEAASPQASLTEGSHKDTAHQPTVEDDAAEPASSDKQVQSQQPKDTQVTKEEAIPQSKFWVSERSVGEFSRSFSFPVRVDQDQVTASMKNGILSIVVPKAKKVESRKINID